MSRTTSNFAAGVSRTLRKQGIRVLYSGNPATWSGIRVEGFLDRTASITVDYPDAADCAEIADRIAETLTAAGYDVQRGRTDVIDASTIVSMNASKSQETQR